VLAIDKNLALVEAVADDVSEAVCFDATQRALLESHAVHKMDGIVVGIGEDFESMVLVTALAKEMGVPVIVGRAYDDVQRRILKIVGATEVVNPEEEVGKRLARSLTSLDVVDFIDLPEGYELRELKLPTRYVDKPLSALLSDCAERVVAVRISREITESTDEGETTRTVRIPVPNDDAPLREGDTVALIGPSRVLERL
jgi:trk system potassium uptake protein TrkA